MANQATYPIGSMTTSTVLRPGDGLPQQTTDQNGLHTYYCYDSLSRLTAVYAPMQTGNRGHTDPCSTYVSFTNETGEVPTAKFGYYVGSYVNNTTRQAKQPAVVWSSIWQTGDTAATDVRVETAAYIDGNGRTRETQTWSPTTGKIIVTAAVTDDRGNTAVTVDAFAVTDNLDTNGFGKPGDRTSPPSLTGASEGFATWPSWPSSIDLRTTTPVYDTANRVTSTTVAWDGTTLVTSNTEYRGTTTITKPQIGSWQSTTVDGLGRTMNVKTYNGTTAPGTGTLYGTDAITTYSYATNQNALTDPETGWTTTTVTDDAGNATIVVADLLGRTVRSTDPNAGLSTFFYDAGGNITKTVDAASNTVNTSYDAMNRPTYRWSGSATSWAGAATTARLASWTYDSATRGKGMPATESSWNAGYEYKSQINTYTGRYQPSSTTMTIPAAPIVPSSMQGAWSFSATYNEGGQQLTHTSPNAPGAAPSYTLTTGYNGYAMADKLSESATVKFVTGTSFDDLGRVTNRILARNTDYTSEAALVREYGYHTPTGMLDTIKAGWDTTPTSTGDVTWWQHDRYTRDAIGNVKVIEDLGLEAGGSGSNIKECFVYDNWNRLVRAHTAPETAVGDELVGCATSTATSITNRGTTDPYDTVWTFDDINRMRTSTNQVTTDVTTWGYTGTKHAPTSLTGATTGTYTYNNVGGMATRNGDTLTYDAQQRLTNYNTSGVDDEYVYTTTNQRLLREHGTTVTLYLAGMEVTWDGTTSTVTRYPSIAGATVATHTTIIGGGTPTVTWNCGSMQNTTVCQAPTATSATPPVPARKRYTPYGDQRGTTTFSNTDHGFLGQPEDSTGLTYLNNRYHDPQLAAFTSVDPLVAKTGTPYLYGNGNPATLSDPSGLEAGCGATSYSATSCSEAHRVGRDPVQDLDDRIARAMESASEDYLGSPESESEVQVGQLFHVGPLDVLKMLVGCSNKPDPHACQVQVLMDSRDDLVGDPTTQAIDNEVVDNVLAWAGVQQVDPCGVSSSGVTVYCAAVTRLPVLRPGVNAITIGHFILYDVTEPNEDYDPDGDGVYSITAVNGDLLRHEMAHVSQYEMIGSDLWWMYLMETDPETGNNDFECIANVVSNTDLGNC